MRSNNLTRLNNLCNTNGVLPIYIEAVHHVGSDVWTLKCHKDERFNGQLSEEEFNSLQEECEGKGVFIVCLTVLPPGHERRHHEMDDELGVPHGTTRLLEIREEEMEEND